MIKFSNRDRKVGNGIPTNRNSPSRKVAIDSRTISVDSTSNTQCRIIDIDTNWGDARCVCKDANFEELS